MPLYDLALMTAADCARTTASDVELSLVTPEEQPLVDLRRPGQRRGRRLLRETGITVHTNSYGVPSRSRMA